MFDERTHDSFLKERDYNYGLDLPVKGMPQLDSDLIGSVKSVVSWVEQVLPRQRLDRSDIMNIGKLSINELIHSGLAHYMGGCINPTYLSAFALSQGQFNGNYNPTLIVEMVTYVPKDADARKNSSGRPQPHVAIEFPFEEKIFSLDYTSRNRVVLKEGEYVTNQPDSVVSLKKSKLSNLDYNLSFVDNAKPFLNYKGTCFDVDSYLNFLASINEGERGDKNFERFKKEIGGEIKYFLEHPSTQELL